MYFKRKTYYTFESIDEVRNRVKDFSRGFFKGPNLSAREIAENSFIITQKYSINLFYGSPAIIEASLAKREEGTKIQVLFRITYQALVAQVFFSCLFVFGCFYFNNDLDKALMFIFISLLGLSVVHVFHAIAVKRLQNIFESALGIP